MQKTFLKRIPIRQGSRDLNNLTSRFQNEVWTRINGAFDRRCSVPFFFSMERWRVKIGLEEGRAELKGFSGDSSKFGRGVHKRDRLVIL
jgi:hypothetical protein